VFAAAGQLQADEVLKGVIAELAVKGRRGKRDDAFLGFRPK
jgi:hypothetical protein